MPRSYKGWPLRGLSSLHYLASPSIYHSLSFSPSLVIKDLVLRYCHLRSSDLHSVVCKRVSLSHLFDRRNVAHKLPPMYRGCHVSLAPGRGGLADIARIRGRRSVQEEWHRKIMAYVLGRSFQEGVSVRTSSKVRRGTRDAYGGDATVGQGHKRAQSDSFYSEYAMSDKNAE